MSSDWKNAVSGNTVKIATQKTFKLYSELPRGATEEINKACDAFFKKKGIVYGESWFSQRKQDKEKS